MMPIVLLVIFAIATVRESTFTHVASLPIARKKSGGNLAIAWGNDAIVFKSRTLQIPEWQPLA
jgi:hypothetical protein